MKKILILLVAFCLCGCSSISVRDNDKFIVKGIQTHNDKYNYEYTLYQIISDKLCREITFYSNEKYELNDTLRLMK